MSAHDQFLESLPEAHEEIFLEFLNELRQARTIEEVNVISGIAWQRLKGQEG